MPEKIRALVVILALAVPAFYMGRRIASSLNADRDFVVWRNAWFAVTIGAFLSGSYVIHAAMVVVVCLYASAVGAATVGLYFVLLFAAPLANIIVGAGGIVNYLIQFNNGRLLALVLLVPILFKSRGSHRHRGGVFTMPDWLVVLYVALLTVLEFRVSDATNVLRQGTIYALDVLVPYFAFSRTVTSMPDFRKVFVAFIVAVLPLALIATFEFAKGWRLYSSLANDWGGNLGYLRRDGLLRAAASAFGAISLGFVIMVAMGCLLGLWQAIPAPRFRGIVMAVLGAGLFASLSRGPWVGFAVLLLVFLATGSLGVAQFGKFALVAAMGLALLFMTPLGKPLLDLLPFVGTVDAENVEYRQRLFENAMKVIERNPLFGSTDFRSTPEMQEMIQGQGIIDIVNTYLNVALNSGLIGLLLFVGFFAIILLGLRRVLKFQSNGDPGFNNCVRASIAIVIGMLVTIATVSSIDFIPYAYWSFAGLCVALIRIGYRERAVAARAAFASRVPA